MLLLRISMRRTGAMSRCLAQELSQQSAFTLAFILCLCIIRRLLLSVLLLMLIRISAVLSLARLGVVVIGSAGARGMAASARFFLVLEFAGEFFVFAYVGVGVVGAEG